MKIQVEQNIPVPDSHQINVGLSKIVGEMKLGDSVLVDYVTACTLRTILRRQGFNMVQRKETFDRVRCWKVAK